MIPAFKVFVSNWKVKNNFLVSTTVIFIFIFSYKILVLYELATYI